MKRVVLWLSIAVFAAAAPARAWCEATCLAPVETAADADQSHCTSHAPSDGTTSMSSAGAAECPVLEVARPVAATKSEIAPLQLIAHPSPAIAAGGVSRAPEQRRTAAVRPLVTIPLRI